MSRTALLRTDLPLPLFSRGKVRDTYELADDRLLMVATDRISAFDHVLPTGIPDRGRVLTRLSVFWFGQTGGIQDNHLISADVGDLPAPVADRAADLEGRVMVVRRARRIDFECVIRGYLAGSAWSEYRERGTMAGEPLPAGLRQSERLPAPIFTPATKNDDGHDENIPFSRMEAELGADLAGQCRDASLRLYEHGARYAEQRGLILADTKFEFGLIDDHLVLIDEALTPDSSRYWDAARYDVGTSPESYDKQFVRDWLSQSGWDRESEPPALPDSVVESSRERYLRAYELLTGESMADLVRAPR
jgi:phosphoribosylaminoimidazole-succinocarboxamide synthase